MSIKDDFKVEAVPSEQTHEWILKKHYARRLPMAIEYSYCLYDKDNLPQGVCIFGPTAPTVPLTIFGEHNKHKIRELTRLVINEGVPRGVLSFFVSRCISMLDKPMCLVSFSDGGLGHHGYIYQATNWIYTGQGGERFDYIDNGKTVHRITLVDRSQVLGLSPEEYIKQKGIEKVEAKPKYRYLYFIGSKQEIKKMKSDCKLKSLPYPKGDNKRYDASYSPDTQTLMF